MNQATPSSRLTGFHKQSVADRIGQVSDFAGLNAEERALLANTGNLPQDLANHLIENMIGTMNIPVGVEYLADLTRMFPNLPEAVAASYNGGEDNVARWVKRATQKDPGVFAAEVGYTESKDYVFKVMANYRAYKQLYTADLRRQR